MAAGGKLPNRAAGSQFYPPTVITGVTPNMRIWQEEVFGPVMAGAPVACGRLLPVVALALTTLPGLEGSRSRVTLSNGASSGGGTPDIHRMVQLRPKHCMPCALGRRYGI